MAFHDVMSKGYEKSVLCRFKNNPDASKVFNNSETGDLSSKVDGVKQAGQLGSIEYLHAWIKAEAREIGVII